MSIKSRHLPIFILLIISLLIGIFTFQDYGMTWDEYLYYQYADSIGYAYSIPERMSEDYDINLAYGPSAGDHRNRGPAYLLIARIPVNTLHALTDIDKVALWHLMNFITFLLGVFYLYKLALRWLKPESAFGAALLFLSQPLFWGHAFINPKDPPFMTLFIITLYYGFDLVDQLSATDGSKKTSALWKQIILVGILIGLATNLRIIAPLLAMLLIFYAVLKGKPKILVWFIPIAFVAIPTTYLTWPYLWDAPIERFIEVLTLMSNNPTKLKVLFYGNLYRAYELPRRYLPVLLGIKLTEPTWLLFIIGSIVIFFRIIKKTVDFQSLLVLNFLFYFMLAYVLAMRPPMYDGFRHFLFILPPIFIVAGFAFEELFTWVRATWLQAAIFIIILAFGLSSSIKLHPYEYTYYNAFVGGTSEVEGIYETDYWLTCYKEAIEEFSRLSTREETLIVHREAANAAYYAPEHINIIEYRPVEAGDYLLLSARLNELNTVIQHFPYNIIEIKRDGATFCVIKEITP
ncbi:MAG: hypothetical protein HN855_13710 [Anaerolineae bacterium]|jgi:hypothetical protein|nr:hypothetical protein [Anaerolineae bacterium]MBT7326212.1 hypothetical protein [Anaerolineae bacterium]MBT7599959.1 hypothetical protein [Anaerolineae bacterium]